MDVVDDEKARREEDGQTGHMHGLLVRQRSRFVESKAIRCYPRQIFQNPKVLVLPAQCIDKNKLGHNNCGSLKVNCLPRVIT